MDSTSPNLFILSDMERLKCSLFSIRMIIMLVIFCILCVCLSALIPMKRGMKMGCGRKGCKCQIYCECENGYCACMRKCNIETANTIEAEGFGNVTVKADNESFKSGTTFDYKKTQVTRKFEMVSQTNKLNSPKNLLFGEGEFIFTKDKVNVFIIASVYTIGANLYAAKNHNQVTGLHYNVYLGNSKKILNGKLGELKRSLDGRYKLELISSSKKFIEFIAKNEYISIRLEDDSNTLRQTVLEAFY